MLGLRISSVFLLVVVLIVAARAQFAHSTGFTVNNTTDTVDASPGDGVCADAGGQCTLRAAIMETNAQPDPDTITLPAGTYVLTIPGVGEDSAATGDVDILGDVTITGASASDTVIDGGKIDRVLQVAQTENLKLAGVRIQNGGPASPPGSDQLDGGGIYNQGTLIADDIAVTGNWAWGSGGGISNGGLLTLTNSTISGNYTTGRGGGIHNSGFVQPPASGTLTNVTISDNAASIDGGGIRADFLTDILLDNVTVSANDAQGPPGGGISGIVRLKNTIVAYNGQGDCKAPMDSLGHNLDSDGSCGFAGPGDLANTDPLLGPLADNGGPTKTHALLPGSPAIDAGDDANCPATDQRGVSRPQGASCDIGAYEATAPTPTPQPGTISGDVDCNGGVTAVDALQVLRFVAGLPSNLPPGCPPVGAAAAARNFADVTCDGNVDSVDALRILRYIAGLLALPTEPGCLPIGAAPTPTPTPTPSPTPFHVPNSVLIDPANATVAAGGDVTVSVIGEAPTGKKMGAWDLNVTYDDAVLDVAACNAWWDGACNPDYGANQVRFGGVSVSGLLGQNVLATITFHAIGAAGASSSLVVAGEAFDEVADPLSPTFMSGTVSVGAAIPTPTPIPSLTSTPTPAPAGRSVLQVANSNDFVLRDAIVTNPGGPTEERSVKRIRKPIIRRDS